MSKFSKISIITGISLIVLSLIVAMFDFSKVLEPFIKSDKDKYTEINKVVSVEQLKSIVVNSANEKITIKNTDSKEIKITYFESDKTKYDFKETMETITLKQTKEKLDFFQFNFNLFIPNITIEIPYEVILAYKIKTSNSQITISNLDIKESTFETHNGKIELNKINTTKNVRLITSNGSIQVKHANIDKLDARSSNGTITLTDSDLNILKCRTTNGKISFSRLTAPNIEMKTSNGGISGTILANGQDYQRNIITSNGKIWIDGTKYSDSLVDREESNNKLTLKTTNASIKINFLK